MLEKKEDNKEFYFSFALFVIFISLLILVPQIKIKDQCGDGTPYSACSETKPYFCDEGVLVEKASACGCENLNQLNDDSCVTEFQTEPKRIELKYILDGEQKKMDFVVYKDMYENLSKTSRVISSTNGEIPSRKDFIIKQIDNSEQKELITPLVVQIQNLTSDRDEQARIAVSFVQNIPYNFSDKKVSFFGNIVNYSRFPYEVLYENAGICEEKSQLLVLVLRELGFETAILYYNTENHEAVGIKCPPEFDYSDTGYCFIETTGPSIISDSNLEYAGGITLKSRPEVIKISDGISLSKNLDEYSDAKEMKSLKNNPFVLFRNYRFEKLRQKYGLIEEYQIA